MYPEPQNSQIITVNVVNRAEQLDKTPANKRLYNEETKELEVFYPEEFTRSENRKFVTVLSVRAVKLRKKWSENVIDVIDNEDYEKTDAELENANVKLVSWEDFIPDIYTLHCSFVQYPFNDDSLVCFLNDPLTTPRRYEQFSTERSFKIWVRDITLSEDEIGEGLGYENRLDLKELDFLGLVPDEGDEDKYKEYQALIIQLRLDY